MAKTEAQKRAQDRYMEKVKQIHLLVPRDEFSVIREVAESAGVSVSAYILDAVREKMNK